MDRVKIVMKYSFDCRPKDLFLALTKPDLLESWIAEKVSYDRKTEIYTFRWGESVESARILEQLNNRYLKWGWESDARSDDEYVIFRINVIPDDDWIDLHIEDYCDENEAKILREGWDDQIKRLEALL